MFLKLLQCNIRFRFFIKENNLKQSSNKAIIYLRFRNMEVKIFFILGEISYALFLFERGTWEKYSNIYIYNSKNLNTKNLGEYVKQYF